MSPAAETDRFAPEGAIWLCPYCGKTSQRDSYGIEGEHSPGWDESCALNAILVHSERHIDSRGTLRWFRFNEQLPPHVSPSHGREGTE